jgi:ribose-phosphate pyrophosphokinase
MFQRLLLKSFAGSALALGTYMYTKSNHKLWMAEEKPKLFGSWRRSKDCEKLLKPETVFLCSGNANKPLAEDIAKHLGTSLGDILVSKFPDGETKIKIKENVRGKDVFIIQPTCPPVNENLMELLLLISTARRASAKRVTAVIPYYGYARQDRKITSRIPISAADVSKLLETAGVDRVIAMDFHCGQIQGFFSPRVPVDNLDGSAVMLDYVLKNKALFTDLNKIVVVSPDAGGVGRARKFQQFFIAKGFTKAQFAMIIKQRKAASEISRMDLVGNVEGRDCIIIDDMIDTAVSTHNLIGEPYVRQPKNSREKEHRKYLSLLVMGYSHEMLTRR